jgi:cell division protein FtsL
MTGRKFAPFISVLILVLVALGTIFIKMETVRMGYELVKLGRVQKLAVDERAQLDFNYARLTRPERLDDIATGRLALARVQKNQVVLMAATGNYAVLQ